MSDPAPPGPAPLRPGSVIAIDHGTKHTGFAVTDALRLAFEPLDPYHGAGDGPGLLDALQALVDERTVAAFVLGLPLHDGGKESERSRAVRAFAASLRARFPGLPVVLRDEHLSTKEAEARLHEAGYRGAEIRAHSDSWAALVLLEEWVREGEPVPPEPYGDAAPDGRAEPDGA